MKKNKKKRKSYFFTSHSVADDRNWQLSEQHWPSQPQPPSPLLAVRHHDEPLEHRALVTSLHWVGTQQGLSSSHSSPGSKTPLPQVGLYGWSKQAARTRTTMGWPQAGPTRPGHFKGYFRMAETYTWWFGVLFLGRADSAGGSRRPNSR